MNWVRRRVRQTSSGSNSMGGSSFSSKLPAIACSVIFLYVLVSFFRISSQVSTFRFTKTSSPLVLKPISFTDGKVDFSEEDKRLWKSRAEDVKQSFLHAWNSYETYAWGADELKPVTHSAINNFNGWGVSIVDSLDTLLIMDLRPQFDRAMEHVEAMTFEQGPNDAAPFFETIIRYVGGLLSAYALVVDDGSTSNLTWKPTPHKDRVSEHAELNHIAVVLRDKVNSLVTALMPAFETATRLPMWGVNTVSGKQKAPPSGGSLLAEIASFQMEFKYLAHITENKEVFDVANNVINILEKRQKQQLNSNANIGGMLPTSYRVETGEALDDYISVGSLADSAYEYFLKGYLLSGRGEPRLLDMYLASTKTALQQLTYISTERNLTYITDARGKSSSKRFEHLSCFYPGLLALGLELLSGEPSRIGRVELPLDLKIRHQLAAEAIAETCWLMYQDNPTTLGSEEVYFNLVPNLPWWDTVNEWEKAGRPTPRPRGTHGSAADALAHKEGTRREYFISRPDWRMRPETIESLYLMFRVTGAPIWRERCYAIYKGMEKYSRVTTGYSALEKASETFNLDPESPDYQSTMQQKLKNDMPSYALAETFKYLYLCMLDPEESKALLPSDKWIFNTEAHPLPVFQWSKQEKKVWGI